MGFVYGCGGTGFRTFVTEDPQGSSRSEVAGIPNALAAEDEEHLKGGEIDWGETPERGSLLRHPDAVPVDFC